MKDEVGLDDAQAVGFLLSSSSLSLSHCRRISNSESISWKRLNISSASERHDDAMGNAQSNQNLYHRVDQIMPSADKMKWEVFDKSSKPFSGQKDREQFICAPSPPLHPQSPPC